MVVVYDALHQAQLIVKLLIPPSLMRSLFVVVVVVLIVVVVVDDALPLEPLVQPLLLDLGHVLFLLHGVPREEDGEILTRP